MNQHRKFEQGEAACPPAAPYHAVPWPLWGSPWGCWKFTVPLLGVTQARSIMQGRGEKQNATIFGVVSSCFLRPKPLQTFSKSEEGHKGLCAATSYNPKEDYEKLLSVQPLPGVVSNHWEMPSVTAQRTTLHLFSYRHHIKLHFWFGIFGSLK